ncbi:hypothetical protein B0T25DRAFT_563769 [Lasiosphaeria hispida]|uniref:Uncharacterized protein n=1 Tax=Lasiosphaeria hispida TaxID=260671 RepID=A0AAJ0HP15_9PEZI|nr:hypothetical protein B0T25DRAFT_563769 [Lasiosphaeria hispida]
MDNVGIYPPPVAVLEEHADKDQAAVNNGQVQRIAQTGHSAGKNRASTVWYAQCVAIAGATPINSQPDGGAVETRVLTTIFSVGGPSPTLVSTFITYVTPRTSRATTATVVTVTLTPDEPCEHEYYC